MRNHNKTSRADKIEIKGNNVVDLTTGDLVQIQKGRLPFVKVHSVGEDPNGHREAAHKFVSLRGAKDFANIPILVHHAIA